VCVCCGDDGFVVVEEFLEHFVCSCLFFCGVVVCVCLFAPPFSGFVVCVCVVVVFLFAVLFAVLAVETTKKNTQNKQAKKQTAHSPQNQKRTNKTKHTPPFLKKKKANAAPLSFPLFRLLRIAIPRPHKPLLLFFSICPFF